MQNHTKITLTIEQLTELLMSPQLPTIQSSLQSLTDFEKRNNNAELMKIVSFVDQDEFQAASTSSSSKNSSAQQMMDKINELELESIFLRSQVEQHIQNENELRVQLSLCLKQTAKLQSENEKLAKQLEDLESQLYTNRNNNRLDPISKSVHFEIKKPLIVKPLLVQPLKQFSGSSGVVTQNPLKNSREVKRIKTERNQQ